jgi:diacylglycerol kinase (ATP)
MSEIEYFVILNPAANRGGAERQWAAAESVLRRAGTRYSIHRTRGQGHAVELAAQAVAEDWPAVVAVGGDGTIHEVANGLLRASNSSPTPPLGILPLGSGNDFVKLVDLPRGNGRLAAERLLRAQPRRVDVGCMNGEIFTNGVGIGFDARVAAAAREVRWLRGMAIYAWALVQVLSRHSTPRMRVVLDGVEVVDGPLTLVTIGNGGCHGGGFWICPAARADDGLFDVCIAEAMTARGVLGFIPYVMRGKHIGRPGVTMHQARRVEISSDEPLPIHADGEIIETSATELVFEVLPERLTLLV